MFQGKFAVKENLRIDGAFEGECIQVENLHIGKTGRVKTDINAMSVVVEGIVIGNITASARILLLSSARVLGDIKTPELIIQEGVVLEGKCTINQFDIQDTKKYIESLYSNQS